MALISVSLPADGSTADVSDYNSPITTVVSEINGNLDNANIKSDAAIDGSKLADASVTNTKLSTTAITLGYTQITSNFTTTSTTPVQVTNLTAAVTIPEGGRRIKITVFGSEFLHLTANSYAVVSIWDGTVGSGTKLNQSVTRAAVAAMSTPLSCVACVVPAAGAKTYNVGLHQSGGGTAQITSAATFPTFILVEAI